MMKRHWQIRLSVALHCLLLVLVLCNMPGCSCSQQPLTAEEEEALKKREELAKKKKKPKPDFEPIKVKALPSDDQDARVVVKPGHWTSFRYKLKANNDDVKGDLQLTCVDVNGDDIPLERSPFTTSSTRTVALPKAQTRTVEAVQYVTGVTAAGEKEQVRLSARLSTLGRQRAQDLMPTVRLRPEQYHFVILSRNPDRHGHLKLRSAIKPPHDEWFMSGVDTLYYVDFPDVNAELPLPTHPLTWTAIAYVLWDDMEPDVLNTSQQAAMLDWLHWGGQLIISGPNTLELLRGSFLEPYLPASSGDSVTLSKVAAKELNEYWHPDGAARIRGLSVREDAPLNLVKLQLTDGAGFVPHSADTVAHRRVGRGRIAVTAFSVADREILDWGSFDAFLHSCLMGKPSREFVSGTQNGQPDVTYPGLTADERLVASGVRYASRDAVAGWDRPSQRGRREASGQRVSDMIDPPPGDGWRLDESAQRYGGFRPDSRYGIGSWSDFSAMANAARASLQAASGIDVPSRQFVLKVLGVYLLCLVPLNWTIFRLLGRVEWAWFVAPAIAVLGAIGVIRSAQLDIGFARSRTEIGVLEIQPDYPRGHLTRFIGLYTSLTTNYEAVQYDRSALFLPFSTDPAMDELRLARQRDAVYAELQRDEVALSGFQVVSNATGMLRCESYLDLPNPPRLIGDSLARMQIENATGFPWYSPIVLTRTKDGVRAAVTDEIVDGTTRDLTFGPPGDVSAIVRQLETSPITSRSTPKGTVSLRTLGEIAANVTSLQLGESRMVAWTDHSLPGLEISPKANQQSTITLVIAHLTYADPPVPQPDLNLRSVVDTGSKL